MNSNTVVMCILVFLVSLGTGILIGHSAEHAGPGFSPVLPYVDDGVQYSADGCWALSGGFWHPLKRCHIVRVPDLRDQPQMHDNRVPNKPDVSWAEGAEGPR